MNDGQETLELLKTHFSEVRLRQYQTFCNGDPARTAAMILWEIQVSSAFWEVLNMLEISLRNLINRQLSIRHRRKNLSGSWIHDPNQEFAKANTKFATDIHKAKQRLKIQKIPANNDRLVAELTFGFWCQLLTKKYKFIWPDIMRGFQGFPDTRQLIIRQLMAEAKNLRNMIGHHQPIWRLDLQTRYENLLKLANYIDPKFETLVGQTSRVPRLLELTPGLR